MRVPERVGWLFSRRMNLAAARHSTHNRTNMAGTASGRFHAEKKLKEARSLVFTDVSEAETPGGCRSPPSHQADASSWRQLQLREERLLRQTTALKTPATRVLRDATVNSSDVQRAVELFKRGPSIVQCCPSCEVTVFLILFCFFTFYMDPSQWKRSFPRTLPPQAMATKKTPRC